MSADIHIPAHPLLLDGWCGPALMHEAGSSTGVAVLGPDERPEAERSGPWTAMPVSGEWPWPCWTGTEHMVRSVTTEALTLDLRRPEVAHRVRDVLKAHGSGMHALLEQHEFSQLHDLPKADRLPTALRLCWTRWLEVRDA